MSTKTQMYSKLAESFPVSLESERKLRFGHNDGERWQ